MPVVLAVSLAACTGISADWVKPGAGEQQIRADNAACRTEADKVFGRTANITHDIEASRQRDLTNVGAQSGRLRSYETERNYEKVFGACMAARGYSKRGDER